ncbi:MAG: hypothetical protein K0Q51_993 [Rickettsiaceae bacterium]|jgi:hypothetical protein|nr:hypothetical protein [Rickettsiaceae bacterium]
MITLFASIAGFISSIFPEILKLIKDKNDKVHELNILDRQIEFSKLSSSKYIEEVQASRDIAESFSLYSTYKTGISWIDALNGTVRPMLAYSFFALYGFIKYTQYKAISSSQGPIIEYLDIIWSVDDQAIFAGIISFYFGQRTFNKLWKKY